MIVADYRFRELSPRECFEFRIGIEGEAAAAAARYRTAADLRFLSRSLERLSLVKREINNPGIEEDFEFHLGIALASRNDYFVTILTSLKDTIGEVMLLARTTTGLKTYEKLVAIEAQHRRVYEAITDGDEVRARLMMREHLHRCKSSTSQWDTYMP